MRVREATVKDFDELWPFMREIIAQGDTYAYPRDMDRECAFNVWFEQPVKTFVVEQNDKVLATYYIKTNQAGPGDHVCNCGYMVASSARGKGIATQMCEHSQKIALTLGYKAMQFNFVASSNSGAVRLWQRLGFDICGRLPKAFKHPDRGYVDALVMFKWLATD
ncbi:GNAT family N-acetyltransferase [Thalassotalea litorea]|uniref:GNAT family N-acetyltransferase n=1 Tax=Thalassotalea litorea TaxID=2020715 RepID=A0A5R9J018_9GAMM|nr:GNAT family N-acetyltransferase [Thalassotalea litorea]TLU67498.1 GNAT family N-acetyltransferase [Thalassotalea litorea]